MTNSANPTFSIACGLVLALGAACSDDGSGVEDDGAQTLLGTATGDDGDGDGDSSDGDPGDGDPGDGDPGDGDPGDGDPGDGDGDGDPGDGDGDGDGDPPDLCATPSFEPIAWWRGEGDATDAFGVYDGTFMGGPSYGNGEVGQAFNFGGANAVSVAQDDLYPFGSFTVEAWVSASSDGSVVAVYECGDLCLSQVSNSLYVLSILDNGHLHGNVRDSDAGGPDNNGQFIEGHTNLIGGAFHHVAFVRDVEQDTLSLYVDGNIDAIVPLDPGAAGPLDDDDADPDPLMIGAQSIYNTNVPTGFLTGQIDEAAIYFAALPASDIADIYAAKQAGKCVP